LETRVFRRHKEILAGQAIVFGLAFHSKMDQNSEWLIANNPQSAMNSGKKLIRSLRSAKNLLMTCRDDSGHFSLDNLIEPVVSLKRLSSN